MEVGLKMAIMQSSGGYEREGVGECKKKKELKFEETELRLGLGLGLPNGNEGGESQRKRGFSQTVVDLKLNLNHDADGLSSTKNDNNNKAKETTLLLCATHDPAKPPPKTQVVGWPPVRSYRKNTMTAQKSNTADETAEKGGIGGGAAFVKVSMEGAPYLRKVDLTMYKSYQELYEALGKMFSSFTIGSCGSQGMKEFMNERKLMDLLNGSDYVPSYEDKDGDWMLVGDVPWEMFVELCKRLRIMKGTEAVGLAPRAMAKCKNRN